MSEPLSEGPPPDGPPDEPTEGRRGVARVEAFSDGVVAILITIMVLELKAPEEPGFHALRLLWPTFVAYVLSYAYIAIYWVNHHRLFSHARIVTNSLVWSNIALLFALSLVPFATAELGKDFAQPSSAALYALSLLLPSLAYRWLEGVIARTGANDPDARAYHRITRRKGGVACIAYGLAVPLSLYWPLAAVIVAGLVAVFWVLPWSPFDRLFER